jgi:hypothetical protein
MKKNNLLALLFTCFSIFACCQNKPTAKPNSGATSNAQSTSADDSENEPTVKPHSGPECGCGPGHGAYGESYRALEAKDWAAIEGRLDTFLSIKDIKKSREYGYSYHAYSTLMRMHDIEWTTHKKDALRYLEAFVKKILAGASYLTTKNKNKMYQKDGCPWGLGDALSIPSEALWVILKIDTNYGVQLIDNMWGSMTTDEPFSNRFRLFIVWALRDYFRNPKVQTLLTKIEKSKLGERDLETIKKMRFEYEMSKISTQKEAWDKFISIHKANAANNSIEKSKTYDSEWYDNLGVLDKIYTDVDVTIPLELAEKEKDFTLKCGLAHSCCMILNGKHPEQAPQNIMTRIDKLVQNIKLQPLDKNENEKQAMNNLNIAYKALKKWQK